MLKHTRTFASVIAAGALLAVPATGMATQPADKGKNKPHKPGSSCTKVHNVGFTVHGTLVSVVADDPATPASEATVTLKVTSANSHARKSGDIADQDAVKPGVQVAGATYTVAAGDAYALKLKGYEGTDTPSLGDKVKVHGKIARTKNRCAPAGTTVADRYGAIDVRRVMISDRDPDA